jgi:hypothetical protein
MRLKIRIGHGRGYNIALMGRVGIFAHEKQIFQSKGRPAVFLVKYFTILKKFLQ